MRNRWEVTLFGALLAFIAVSSFTVDGFATGRNWSFLLLDLAPILLIALPMTLIVISGEIDLSVASILGLSSAIMGQLWLAGLSLQLIVILCPLIGALLGAVNGLFVTRFGLPSLAVTIGTLALYRGLAFVVLGDRAVADFPFSWTGGSLWTVLAIAALAGLFAVVLHATAIGRGLFAIGSNAEAATYAGLSATKTKFWLYVVSGAVAALAGILWTLRYASARADNGTGLELQVVAAVLLGGVSIFGGRGTLAGVLAGVLLLGTVRNALQLADVSTDALTVVTGTLLILSVVVPAALGRRSPRKA